MPASADREARLLSKLQESMEVAVDAGVIRVRITDDNVSGTSIRVSGRDLINFGSCSYMGLGQDDRLKRAAIAAVERFGPSYSSSATYAAVDLYTELERLLRRIFDGNTVVVAPTTTLMHLAALPVVVRRTDAVIVDVQAHASMQLTVEVLRGRGITVKTIPHNHIRAMQRAVAAFSASHERVWLLVDGVYSMYGDTAPVEAIVELMDEFGSLHVYFDDAHGFGWAGDGGVGVVLERTDLTDRMLIAISLSKAFGAGGGALVCGDDTMAQQIIHTGGTLIFGGPIHPAVLGAAIESAKLMLSPEQQERKERLLERVDFVNRRCAELELPAPFLERTPITFVEVGTTDQAIRMARIMLLNGFFVNVSSYPVVPKGHGGLRFTVTADHSLADIDALLTTLATYLNLPDDIDLTELGDDELALLNGSAEG